MRCNVPAEFEKKKLLPSHCRYRESATRLPRSLPCQPPGQSGLLVIVVLLIYACTYHGSMAVSTPIWSHQSILLIQRCEAQGFEWLQNMSPSAPTQSDDKLYTDIAASSVKLTVRFHPMQSKSVQECREALWHCWVTSPGPVSGRTFAHHVDNENPPP